MARIKIMLYLLNDRQRVRRRPNPSCKCHLLETAVKINVYFNVASVGLQGKPVKSTITMQHVLFCRSLVADGYRVLIGHSPFAASKSHQHRAS